LTFPHHKFTIPPVNAQEVSQQTPRAFVQRAQKATAYITFTEARKNGQSIGASSRAAGISRNTGTRYETLRLQEIEHENRLLDAKGAILTKTEVAEELSSTLRDCEPQYKAAIASSLAKVMGYEAPQRSQIEVRQIPASVNAWLEQLGTVDAEAKIIESSDCTPTKALTDKAST
jgi:phosphotransferase system HPr-like phosphotransfer protein